VPPQVNEVNGARCRKANAENDEDWPTESWKRRDRLRRLS